MLCGCSTWRFATDARAPFATRLRQRRPRDKGRDSGWEADYLLEADGTPVLLRTVYDWGSWCHHVFRVDILPRAVNR